MPSRCWTLGIVVLLAASVGGGCGSAEGPDGPVAASIASGGGEEQAAASTPAASNSTSEARPAPSDPLHPVVEIETSQGTLTVELDAEKSPGTVTNFLNYVNAGHYDQTIFHFVSSGKMIVGGGFTTQFEPKPTSLPIRNEAHNGLKNTRGTIAMSRPLDSIDSATSQFYVNLTDNPALDHADATPEGYGYCVFGRVVAGLETADRIGSVATHDQGEFVSTPQEPVVILSIRQLR